MFNLGKISGMKAPVMKGASKIMKSFKSNSGAPKGMSSKMKKIDKSARKSGF